MLERIRDSLPYQPVLLGTVALCAAAALTAGNLATRDAIAAAEAKDRAETLRQVLPDGFADNDLLTDTIGLPGPNGQPRQVHVARRSGDVKGIVFGVAERGYSGEIRLLMAVDLQGQLLGVRVVKHTETPGLGDKIEAQRHPWILGFAGKSLQDPPPERWAVKKDGGVFDAFAGATITPRAVVKAVRDGLIWASKQHEAIAQLSTPPTRPATATPTPVSPKETRP